jgi:hypothetical protein
VKVVTVSSLLEGGSGYVSDDSRPAHLLDLMYSCLGSLLIMAFARYFFYKVIGMTDQNCHDE